tara:strand:+ start:34956 stop:35558 length:603 start_codon:yes stop_codon:yes gene_type:complete
MRQSPDLWIVTTDTGEVPAFLPDYAEHHHIESAGADEALIRALAFVPSDHAVIVMEDDDWYAPNHVEVGMMELRSGADFTCGDKTARWHLPTSRWSGWHQPESFIQGTIMIHPRWVSNYTGIIGSWKNGHVPKHVESRYPEATSVGIKGVGHGLPGRAGATNSHKKHHRKVAAMPIDKGYAEFRKAIGDEDAKAYLELLL